MREFAKGFYKSTTWQKCRAGYVKYKKGLCEKCLSVGLVTAGEIVHHKTHLTADNINDPSVSLSFDNLELLCRKCHGSEHQSIGNKRYLVDEFGSVYTTE